MKTTYANYVAAANEGYEAAAQLVGANGYKVWQSHVLGLDPDDENAKPTATITMDGDTPVVICSPDTPELRAKLTYTIYGKKSLADEDWMPTTDADRKEYQFFKVGVEVK